MDYTKHWTSERARKKQTALTKLSNGLLNEAVNDPATRDLFEPEELEAMRLASIALGKAKGKFAHLKEKKARIEKRKEQEAQARSKKCSAYANKIIESLAPASFCNKELICLWVTATRVNENDFEPERWELDINSDMDSHYLASDDELRRRHVRRMRDSALQTFEKYLSGAWRYSFEKDAYISEISIEDKAKELANLVTHSEYAKVEKCYADLFEPLGSYNRKVEAVHRRKSIKAVK